MRNHSSLLLVLFLVDGVFGDTDAVKSVSVIEGDSVTLNSDLTDIRRDDKIVWMFGAEKEIIAKIVGGEIFKNGFSDGRFRDSLELDSIGSLTIKNIKKEHEGLYKLDISGIHETSKRFSVTVRDKDNVETVSVMEGDTVTLHSGVTDIQRHDQIPWKFGDQGTLIARLNGPVDTSWKNFHLNDQTGDLTIRNIRRDQTGVYKVEINTSSMILHRKLYIVVDEVKTVSVNEGDSIILRTGVINIQECDQILWKFVDHLMAKINKGDNQFSLFSADGRFEGRLHPDHQTGSLTISKSRTTDSGDYHLLMNNSTYTIQRSISVTVSDQRTPDPGPHANYEALIVGLVLGIGLPVAFAFALIFYCCKKKHREMPPNPRAQADFSEEDEVNGVMMELKESPN